MKKTIISVFLFIVIGLVGCGGLSIPNTSTLSKLDSSITINADGSITHTIVEEFNKDYYSVSSLETMIQEEIETYCHNNKAAFIKLQDVKMVEEDKSVQVEMNYNHAEVYADFNMVDFFYGTVEEAYKEGKLKNARLKSVKGKESDSIIEIKSEDSIDTIKNLQIVIMEENMNLYTSGEILYIDDSGIINSKKSIEFEDSSNHIIIFK